MSDADSIHVRHKRFKIMPQYNDLIKLLGEGASLRQAARFCQANGFFVNVPENTLLAALSKLRSDEVVGYIRSPAEKRRMEKDNADLIDPSELVKVDTAEELDRLYKMQLGRINMAVKFERKMKVINRNIVREIETASSILYRKHEIEGGSTPTISNNIDFTLRPEIEFKVGEGARALESAESASRVLSVAKGLARLGLGLPTESGTIDVLEEPSDDSSDE